MENCQLIRIRIGNFLSQLIRIRISFPQKDRTPNNNNRYHTSLMVHMKSELELVTVVSAKTILNRATGGLCELSHRPEVRDRPLVKC